jgi:alpha-tubulin suppressor-like RCC1 family protein
MPRFSSIGRSQGFGAPGGVASPTASFNTTPSSINEGSAGSFGITTTNFASGTLYWTINHVTTNAADFNNIVSGSFSISASSGTFSVTPIADFTTEGAETFTVSIRTNSTSGTVIATSASVTVNDTSTTVTATVTRSATVRGESNICLRGGQAGLGTFNLSVACTGYNSQLLYWRINHGTTSSSHFTTNSGSFTTSGTGTGTISLTTTNFDSGGNARTFTVGVSPDNFGTQVGVSATQTLYERFTVALGQNTGGQLGDSTTVNKSSLVFTSGTDRANLVGPVSTFGQWSYNYYGAVVSNGLKSDGTLWIWGVNTTGQWGNNTSAGAGARSSPVQLTTAGAPSNLYYGADAYNQYTIALGYSNLLCYTWGSNFNGSTGGGTGVNSGTRIFPAVIAGNLTGSACQYTNMNKGGTTYAITTAGASYAWGYNLYGQTGSGTITNTSTPGLVSSSYVAMVGGAAHTIWLQNTGRVFSMGYNGYGNLGDNLTVNKSNAALLFPTGSSYSQIASAGYAGFAIDINGRLFGWGLAPYHGGNTATVNRSSPVQLMPGTTWSKVDAGGSHAMAVTTGGVLYTWGDSLFGSASFGAATIRSSPTQIMTNVTASGTGSFTLGAFQTVFYC